MADDTGTVVLDPVAETTGTDDAAPQLEETAQVEGTAETDPGDEGSETETYTREQVEAEKEAALAEFRAQAQAEAQEHARVAERQQVDAQWQSLTADWGTAQIRNIAAWAARQAEQGKSPEEVATLVQGVVMKQFIDRFKTSAKPYLYHEVFTELNEVGSKTIESSFPDWKPSRETESKLRAAIQSGDAAKAVSGLLAYMRQAIEDTEVPGKVKALTEAEKKKQQSAQEVARLQKPGAAGPAKLAGSDVPGRLTLAQIEAMPTAKWMALPKERREQLLANARRG